MRLIKLSMFSVATFSPHNQLLVAQDQVQASGPKTSLPNPSNRSTGLPGHIFPLSYGLDSQFLRLPATHEEQAL